jgi:hypothetical protein
MWKWIKKNKFAAAFVLAIGWVAHYTFETIIVQNVLKLAGLAIPLMVI